MSGPTAPRRPAVWTEPARGLRGRGQARGQHLTREQLRKELRERYWLRLHVAMIALLTLGALWLCSAMLMHAGVESLALRYGLACPVAYGVYLLLLRWWGGALARRDSPLDGLDVSNLELPSGSGGSSSGGLPRDVPFRSGGGGDFAGGGAQGSWDTPGSADGLGALSDGAGSMLDGLGNLGDLDEGAVVVVPLAVLVAIVALLGALLGAGVFMLFGVEVLLAVAVELGLASLAGSVAYKGYAEVWLGSALRHTWRGGLAVLVLSVALGAVLDRWVPEARSLPHAARLIRG